MGEHSARRRIVAVSCIAALTALASLVSPAGVTAATAAAAASATATASATSATPAPAPTATASATSATPAPAPTATATVASTSSTLTLVRRPARVTTGDVLAWFQARTPGGYRASVPVAELIADFQDEGDAQGISWDVAFVQSVIETGWFRFPSGGQVKPTDNNFGGLGAVDTPDGSTVATFPTARLGVRAQVQHLWAYADPAATAATTARPLVDPRFDLVVPKGKAQAWDAFGNGIWANEVGYGTAILSLYGDLLDLTGARERRWVDQIYADLLGRPSDPGGEAWWSGRVRPDGRASVATRMIRQPEGLGAAVDRSYRWVLGRTADPGGRAFWAARLAAGAPLTEVVANLAASPELGSTGGAPANDGQWVDAAYRVLLGRAVDAGGLAFWTGVLGNRTWTRVAAAANLQASAEGRALRADALFRLVLHRPAVGSGRTWLAGVLVATDDLAAAATLEATDEAFALAQA